MPGQVKGQRRARSRSAEIMLSPRQIRSYLLEKAGTIAPRDVETLVSQDAEARSQLSDSGPGFDRARRQLDLALRILGDHVTQEAPQIPYQTISLLAVALLYLLEPVDLIPDCIPGGKRDDAIVLALAFELATAGVERYCLSHDIPIDGLFEPLTRTRHPH